MISLGFSPALFPCCGCQEDKVLVSRNTYFAHFSIALPVSEGSLCKVFQRVNTFVLSGAQPVPVDNSESCVALLLELLVELLS